MNKITKWLSEPPKHCDMCNADISDTFIDGRTVYGPWANMCPVCHSNIGCGFGIGRGQKYLKQNNEWIKVEG